MGFKCKQFRVEDDKCAMKVNTDSLLLGSWVNVDNSHRVLDIGTGCGLLALMMAQRTEEATFIDAIDIDRHAANQARDNFASSSWHNRLNVEHQDVLEIVPCKQNTELKYDLIITNPPYFATPASETQAYNSLCISRQTARQETALSPLNLFKWSKLMTSDKGSLACVYPFSRRDEIVATAGGQGWHLNRELVVKPTPTKPPHIVLFQFSQEPREYTCGSLCIRERDCGYSADFRQLCSAFYLNF